MAYPKLNRRPSTNRTILSGEHSKNTCDYWLLAVLLSLYFAIVQSELAFSFKVPAVFRYLVVTICFLSYFYAARLQLRLSVSAWREFLTGRVLLLVICTLAMAVHGLLRGNGAEAVLNEAIFFTIIAAFYTIGKIDRIWYIIDKPMTIFVYLGALLIFFFKDSINYGGNDLGDVSASSRYMTSIGAALRPLCMPSLFLIVWGVFNHRNLLWKVLQIGTAVPLLITDVGLFQFRGTLFFFGLCIINIIMFATVFRNIGKLKHLSVLAIIVTLALSYIGLSNFGERFFERVAEAKISERNLFESRRVEFEVFLEQMGTDLWLGRGLGGTYNASEAFGVSLNAYEWRTVHFGIGTFLLRGGVVYYGFLLYIIAPVFFRKRSNWYDDPCNATAFVLLPILFGQALVNPIYIAPAGVLRWFAFGLVLARLAREHTYIDNRNSLTRNIVKGIDLH